MSLTVPQENVLCAAYPHSGVTLTRLAATAGLTPGAAGQVVNSLLRRGLLDVFERADGPRFSASPRGRRYVQ